MPGMEPLPKFVLNLGLLYKQKGWKEIEIHISVHGFDKSVLLSFDRLSTVCVGNPLSTFNSKVLGWKEFAKMLFIFVLLRNLTYTSHIKNFTNFLIMTIIMSLFQYVIYLFSQLAGYADVVGCGCNWLELECQPAWDAF